MRIKSKKYSSQLRQLVKVEGSDGRHLDLNIKADVKPDFILSQSEFRVSRESNADELDLELIATHPDIDLDSVGVQLQSGRFKASSIQTIDGKLKLKLVPASSFDSSVTKEILDVFYSMGDGNRKHSQSIELRFKSDEISAKPRMVVLKEESDAEKNKTRDKSYVQGELTLHNLPTNHDLQAESKMLLKFENKDEVVQGQILHVLPTGTEGTAKIQFRIQVGRKVIAEHVKLRNWVPVSIEIGAYKISDVKFVFVLE